MPSWPREPKQDPTPPMQPAPQRTGDNDKRSDPPPKK